MGLECSKSKQYRLDHESMLTVLSDTKATASCSIQLKSGDIYKVKTLYRESIVLDGPEFIRAAYETVYQYFTWKGKS